MRRMIDPKELNQGGGEGKKYYQHNISLRTYNETTNELLSINFSLITSDATKYTKLAQIKQYLVVGDVSERWRIASGYRNHEDEIGNYTIDIIDGIFYKPTVNTYTYHAINLKLVKDSSNGTITDITHGQVQGSVQENITTLSDEFIEL